MRLCVNVVSKVVEFGNGVLFSGHLIFANAGPNYSYSILGTLFMLRLK